jgi:tetratricopeptide (TPR) repeat protein
LGILTWNQSHIYKDLETFSRVGIQRNPESVDGYVNLGAVLLNQGRFDEAAQCAEKAYQFGPNHTYAKAFLARILIERGEFEEGLFLYRQVLREMPGLYQARNNLAWQLATHEDAGFRNGPESVTLAEETVAAAGRADPNVLDTLAAAYAEAGRFPEAVDAAQKAFDIASSSGEEALASEIKQRMELYRSGRPYHRKPGSL